MTMRGHPLHQEPYRLLVLAAMVAARMVPCNERGHSLQLRRHLQLWQANERLVNDPNRVQRWQKGASFEYPGESCLPCFSMVAMGIQIRAVSAIVKSATLRYTETRWLSLINPTIPDWLSAPLCDQKVA